MKNTDPWKKIDEMINYAKPPEGPEWFTPTDFAQRYGISRGQACAKLRELSLVGRLKVWKGSLPGKPAHHTLYAPA
jgi:hypothetical protein